MKRIDAYGATAENKWTSGDPVLGVPATRVSADWMNVLRVSKGFVLKEQINSQGEVLKTFEDPGLSSILG